MVDGCLCAKTRSSCPNGQSGRAEPLYRESLTPKGSLLGLFFPNFGIVPWQPLATNQVCSFRWASRKWPEANMGPLQTGHLAKLNISLSYYLRVRVKNTETAILDLLYLFHWIVLHSGTHCIVLHSGSPNYLLEILIAHKALWTILPNQL